MRKLVVVYVFSFLLNPNKNNMNNKISTTFKCVSALAFLGLASSAHAQLNIELNGTSGVSTAVFSDLATDPATSDVANIVPTGSLAGATGSFSFAGDAANTRDTAGRWDLSGPAASAVVTITESVAVSTGGDGWGAKSGNIGNHSGGQLLTFTFDLSNLTLGAGESLQLDSFTTGVKDSSGSGFYVSGVSNQAIDTVVGAANTVNVAIVDGTTIAFAGAHDDGTGSTNASESFRVSDLSFSVIPEPSAYGLLAGMLVLTAVMIRRRA
jgi:hypothetical protein